MRLPEPEFMNHVLRSGFTHRVPDGNGHLWVMTTKTTIVVFQDSGEVLVHPVESYGPISVDEDGEEEWAVFEDLAAWYSLSVVRVVDDAAKILGLYDPQPHHEWGYLLNLTQPELSGWALASTIQGRAIPADIPNQRTSLADMADTIWELVIGARRLDPRAVALASQETAEDVYHDIPAVSAWLGEYREALLGVFAQMTEEDS